MTADLIALFADANNGRSWLHGSVLMKVPAQAQLRGRMAIIAPYTDWVRSFGATDGLEQTCRIAHEFGLRCAMGAWISGDTQANATQIQNLAAAANRGEVDVAIVGNEVLLRNGQLIEVLRPAVADMAGAAPLRETLADAAAARERNQHIKQGASCGDQRRVELGRRGR